MRNEISSAVGFIADLIAKKVKGKRSEIFRQVLNRVLCTHYQDHWFPEKPFKGSGYRCIRINHKMDPLIARAGSYCGLTEVQLFEILPSELTMWVDPCEVSYRIGEEGSIGLIYDGESTPALDNEEEEESLNSNNQNNNEREHQQQVQQQQQQQVQQQQQQQQQQQSYQLQQQMLQQQQQSSDFIQSCKDQLRYLLPDSSDAMNFEYLTTFVAS